MKAIIVAVIAMNVVIRLAPKSNFAITKAATAKAIPTP
jgi:hypothetical protein